mmetsp:Transcript_26626/g.38165  ORF Transcript_26626/g.38165 Transcript_26626/m.38165 type:complete len:130 (+) Transcript_26626:414-803(+)|eukprot:CAMPEP_0172423694 /NCGR_PEP_ID=MMETSP1064-20121228/17667_1 /TAXON_ID=202472 /ORGANISM="Aulacoseira subarctica , Strain CCAP 1002/5" /LENGTH=129 /DNA_ID=CAMNT_0013165185 /DNA_START=413 /DNA_END=802 /DNA_ORIENTATION=-
MAPAVSRSLHMIPNEDSDEEGKRSARRMSASMRSTQGVDGASIRKRKRQAQKILSGSRKARRTRKAREGIVSGTTRVIPPELLGLRQSFFYLKMIPQSICREELNREIEEQIIDKGLEEEDLVETWTQF